jgi:serine/threonine-protein phosphatase 6 regulatory subunit 3
MSLWSGSLFAFTSPIDAILDRDDFTLQELLEEDELLQEMKSNNTRLIDKFCEFDSLAMIVRYISEVAPDGSDELRVHK